MVQHQTLRYDETLPIGALQQNWDVLTCRLMNLVMNDDMALRLHAATKVMLNHPCGTSGLFDRSGIREGSPFGSWTSPTIIVTFELSYCFTCLLHHQKREAVDIACIWGILTACHVRLSKAVSIRNAETEGTGRCW